jgi:Fe-S cluster biogenesis protein NfuA
MNGAPDQVIDEALELVNRALYSHAGGVEPVGTVDGVLQLRYIGMCAGCMFRPLTTHATIRPLLREQFGIEVEIIGSRISAEAEERLTKAYAGTGLCPAVDADATQSPATST